MPLTPGAKLGDYELLGPLGAGGMGEVHRARDVRLGREVAIKVLPADVTSDPERLKRFEREARAASSLNHPNIVTVYGIGEAGGVTFLAMELVDGRTLRELLENGPLPAKRLLALGAQIADGLAKAHAAGIVHRDLKPENVMVTREGFAKILDFGLAKLSQSDSGGTELSTMTMGTEPGVVMGTAGYMSPEQALGKAVDFRSDQFAFGCIVYELATGRRAFVRPSVPETLSAIIRDEPPPLAAAAPSLPAPLGWIVERCLAKDPEERYAATLDLARDLSRLKEAVTSGSLSAATAAAPAASAARRRLVPAAAALAGAAAAAAAVFFATRRPPDEPARYHALTFRRGSIGRARFASDGRTVLYDAAWEGGRPRIFSARTEGTTSTALPLPEASLVAVSAKGKMAIAYPGSSRTPVLAESSVGGDAPRELLDGDLDADYSPTADRMVIERDGILESPPGTKLLDPGPEHAARAPRFSPDGKRIAFIDDFGNQTSICVVDLDGKKTVLSRGWEFTSSNLAWHPKTGEIWFSAREFASSGILYLHAVSLSGRHRVVARAPVVLNVADIAADGRVLLKGEEWTEAMRVFVDGGAKETDLSWLDDSQCRDISDDGKLVLFTEGGAAEGANGAVYLRRTDGSPAVRLGDGGAESLSRDGKWALARQGSSAVLLPTGAGAPRTLTPDTLLVEFARFFADGKRVLLVAAERGHVARTWVQDVSGGAPRAVTPEGIGGFCVSPDGARFAARGEGRKAYLYTLDGAPPRLLPEVRPDEFLVRFDADGTGLFLAERTSPLRIHRLDLATGRRDLWKEVPIADPAGFRQVNTVVLTPDGRSYAYTFWRALSRLFVVEGLR